VYMYFDNDQWCLLCGCIWPYRKRMPFDNAGGHTWQSVVRRYSLMYVGDAWSRILVMSYTGTAPLFCFYMPNQRHFIPNFEICFSFRYIGAFR
jgi:hypothetical protein